MIGIINAVAGWLIMGVGAAAVVWALLYSGHYIISRILWHAGFYWDAVYYLTDKRTKKRRWTPDE